MFPQGYAWPQDAISRAAPYLGVRHAHLYGSLRDPDLWHAPGPALLARALEATPAWASARSGLAAMLAALLGPDVELVASLSERPRMW